MCSNTGFELVSPYDPPIPEQQLVRLKGQLHAHWEFEFSSQDNPTPAQKARDLDRLYHKLHYQFVATTEHNLLGDDFPSIVTPPTGEELCAPLFVHQMDCEEITLKERHVLGIGLSEAITNAGLGTASLSRIARRVRDERHGIALLPHPTICSIGSVLHPRSLEDLMQQIRKAPDANETEFSAMALRNASMSLLHREWLNEWDHLLRQGYHVVDDQSRKLPLPGFVEDDYTPLGFRLLSGKLHYAPAGSTWICLETGDMGWPSDLTADGNKARSSVIAKALKTGRWWSYWFGYYNLAKTWELPDYPMMTLSTDATRKKVTVTSDSDLSKVTFIGSAGMAYPLLTVKDVRARTPVSYVCRGMEEYIRVVAKHDPHDFGNIVPWALTILSNPIAVEAPQAPRRLTTAAFTAALGPSAEPPKVKLDLIGDAELEGEKEIRFEIQTADRITHAPVTLGERVVDYAKPENGRWVAKIDFSTIASGQYDLTVEASDSQGRSGKDAVRVRVKSAMEKPTIGIAPDCLEAVTPGYDLAVRGNVIMCGEGAALVGIVVTLDDRPVGLAQQTEPDKWECTVPAGELTPGSHRLGVVAEDALGHQGTSEAAFSVGG